MADLAASLRRGGTPSPLRAARGDEPRAQSARGDTQGGGGIGSYCRELLLPLDSLHYSAMPSIVRLSYRVLIPQRRADTLRPRLYLAALIFSLRFMKMSAFCRAPLLTRITPSNANFFGAQRSVCALFYASNRAPSRLKRNPFRTPPSFRRRSHVREGSKGRGRSGV